MKRNFDWVLKDLNGDDVFTDDKKEGRLTAAIVCTNALLAPGEEKLSGADKVARYDLALRIKRAANELSATDPGVDLKPEEVVLIKKLVGDLYPPLVVGQILPWLDKDPQPKE